MTKEQLIQHLESKTHELFEQQFEQSKKAWATQLSITPESLCNNYLSRCQRQHPNQYIAYLCLRLSQGGMPYYPISDKAKYSGIVSELSDDEIQNVIFTDCLVNDDLDYTLRALCEYYAR